MKKYKKTVVKVEGVMPDDYVKIAGLLYRVTEIYEIGTSYTLVFNNVRSPRYVGTLTFEKNTLMHIWNQK